VTLAVRAVRAGEGERLRKLRLAALANDPDAFGSTLAAEQELPAAWWDGWAARSEAGVEQRTFVVVDAAGLWMGLALVRIVAPEERSHAELNAMWVAPEARGQGAATALADACAAWATEHGCSTLGLNVVVGNAEALAAYERAGFAVRGQKTDVRPDRTRDELALVRELRPPAGPG
jgi:ribosomal protein S18 acetylase RimI-like enzyme